MTEEKHSEVGWLSKEGELPREMILCSVWMCWHDVRIKVIAPVAQFAVWWLLSASPPRGASPAADRVVRRPGGRAGWPDAPVVTVGPASGGSRPRRWPLAVVITRRPPTVTFLRRCRPLSTQPFTNGAAPRSSGTGGGGVVAVTSNVAHSGCGAVSGARPGLLVCWSLNPRRRPGVTIRAIDRGPAAPAAAGGPGTERLSWSEGLLT